jgi:dinuclear metal center YbgI/SA1388 family protein
MNNKMDKSLKLKDVVEFLDNLLDIKNISDSSYNGLQIQGKDRIKKIMFTVDSGIETFKKAIEGNFDMIVVHHGLFWTFSNPSIIGFNKERIKLLLDNNISLYACHLPLDLHKLVGNNAQILKILNCEIISEFCNHKGKNISYIGTLEKEMNFEEIIHIIESKIGPILKSLHLGKNKIKNIAVCSGGGGYSSLSEAIEKSVDLYITGDMIDSYHLAKDAKMNVIFAGHHNSETTGIKALAKYTKNKLKINSEFIDFSTEL